MRALDGVRGIAASVVLIHHLILAAVPALALNYSTGSKANLLAGTPLQVFWAGPAAVLVFFVLSGYVLSLAAARGRPFEPRGYYPSRLLRLYVPVWGAMILAALLHIAISRHAIHGASWWLNAHDQPFGLRSTLHSAALYHSGNDYTSVLWSLRWEVAFSLLLPLYLYLGARWGIAGSFVAIALVAVSGSHALVHYLPVFFLGVAVAFNQSRLPTIGRAGSIGIAVLIACGLTADRWVGHTAISRPVMAIAALAAVCLPLCSAPVNALLTRRIPAWLGSRSFSLYLVHEPILVATAFALHSPTLPLLAVVAVPLALAMTEAFYRVVERPGHALARAVRARVEARSTQPQRAPA